MCTLMNQARHKAFGNEAARLVLKTLPNNWPKVASFYISYAYIIKFRVLAKIVQD